MLSKEKLKELMFPYSKVRDIQDDLIKTVSTALSKGTSLVVHAPTGLGKTVSTLSPALAFAKGKDLNLFFLTSRHTQHKIAIDTLREIKKEHYPELVACDIIGKKWMCLRPEIQNLPSSDFNELCKHLREENKCDLYSNFKSKNGKVTPRAKKVLDELKILSPMHTEKMVEICETEKLCPYEMSCLLASVSHVIVTDYYYLFHPRIRDSFFARIKKELNECIAIIDEGHNLPARIRDLASHRLTSMMVRRGIKEAKKFGYMEQIETLDTIQDSLNSISKGLSVFDEKVVKRDDFSDSIAKGDEYDEVVEDLENIGDSIRDIQKKSSIGGISTFLDSWKGDDDGFVRLVSHPSKDPLVLLAYKCLDPSIVSQPVLHELFSSIIMSGTLSPMEMYKDILGYPETTECERFESPFPDKNRLSLIVPQTTTKYTMRSQKQFENIGKICARIVDEIPGNVLIFFPSYQIMNDVFKTFYKVCDRTVLKESADLSKEEKLALLEKFKGYKKVGSVLLGVISANFAEGIDLPGDLLKGVIVVGLPLQKPDLETKALIKYYEDKFQMGWDYGYIFPAFNRALQSAGRCIRSETDKGVIVFLDERYSWPMYRKYFPRDMDIKISRSFVEDIEEFFR